MQCPNSRINSQYFFLNQCSQPESSRSLSFASQRSVPVQRILDWAPHPRKNSNCICVPSHVKTWLNSWKSAPYDNHMTRLSLSHTSSSRSHSHTQDITETRTDCPAHFTWGQNIITEDDQPSMCVWNSVSASSWGQWTHSRPHCAPGPMRMRRTCEGVCV